MKTIVSMIRAIFILGGSFLLGVVVTWVFILTFIYLYAMVGSVIVGAAHGSKDAWMESALIVAIYINRIALWLYFIGGAIGMKIAWDWDKRRVERLKPTAA